MVLVSRKKLEVDPPEATQCQANPSQVLVNPGDPTDIQNPLEVHQQLRHYSAWFILDQGCHLMKSKKRKTRLKIRKKAEREIEKAEIYIFPRFYDF
jgi:hypothetical protein